MRAAQRKGEPPEKPGRKLIIPADIEYKLEDLCLVLREMKLPIFRFMIINYVNVLIKGTEIAQLLKHKEVRRHWYYNWLNRCKRLQTANIKPLEITRAKWATPENLKTHYDMLCQLFVDLKLAVHNPSYDENVPNSERIKIVKPGRIASMDETRLTNDTTEKNKAKTNRSIVGKTDTREFLANKGGGDGTGIGGSTADGTDLPGFFIFADDIIHAEDVDLKCQPVCRRVDADGNPLSCRFWTNKKGGVTGDLGVRYIRGCVEPSIPDLSPENPAVLIMDGHGSHFTLELLTYCRSIGLHVVLRPPHTTHIVQGEDVVHFRKFKDMYHQSKMTKLGQKVLQGTYKLTVADLLDVCRVPWETAFNQANTLRAWEEIGVNPFTQKVYWDLLEQKRSREAVAAQANVDAEMLTVQGMVRVMFGVQEQAEGEEQQDGRRKRNRDTLHSCDLWDLPGGATGDDCYERVRLKTEERNNKAAATAAKKEQAAAKKQAATAANNDLGSRVCGSLVHAAQLSHLLKPQLEAALAFKGVAFAKTAKKPELLQLLHDTLKLPSDGPMPPLVILSPPQSSQPPPPCAEGDDESSASDDHVPSDVE